jgi:antagonist of KipI
VGTPVSAPAAFVEVLKPGLLDTVQDAGRAGQAHLALSRGGAMDRDALALANVMVGNPPGAAGLEITGPGPTLRVSCDVWIASFGARHELTRIAPDGAHEALATRRPVFVTAGSVLRWRAPSLGWRSWIAFAGGLALPEVLGSRSAHLAAAIGPGRLAAGMRLALHDDAAELARRRAHAVLERGQAGGDRPWPPWQVLDALPRAWPQIELPALAGRHLDALPSAVQTHLLGQTWRVGPQSNRQGLRLHGEPLSTATLPQLASEPVADGTVQLPPGGEPVVLCAEHQTTGGYPRVLEVASCAAPLLAQAAPGCLIHFRLIGLDEADRMARAVARDLQHRLEALHRAGAVPHS